MPGITRVRVLLFPLLMLSVSGGYGYSVVFSQSPDDILHIEDNIVGVLEGGAQHTWFFDGTVGQRIVISAERFPPDPDSELDPLLELYDAAGSLLAMDDNSALGRDAIILDFVLPSTQRYSIAVKNGASWAGGSYQLALAENPFPAGCLSPQGSMIQGEMPSVVNGFPVRYRVFMPPCHEHFGVRYPYVILMHGSNSGDDHWDRLGIDDAIVRGMALGRLPPLAVVLPFGGSLANTNTFVQGASWEYVVVDELMPFVESTYCLQNTRDGRAIGGISRGGFWAFEIAFRNPDLFESLGGHSPFFDLYHAPAAYNPLDLTQVPGIHPPFRIWMDRGRDDYAQLNIDLQHENMLNNGIDHEFKLYAAGRHEDQYWQTHLDDYLRFYTQNWPSDVLTLPLCEGVP